MCNTYLFLSLCYFLSHEAVSCGVCLFWSTWMCGESWLATFNPPHQFSRLGILVSLRPIFLCNFQFLVCDVHICVPLFVWVGITFRPLYSLASVLHLYVHVFPCTLCKCIGRDFYLVWPRCMDSPYTSTHYIVLYSLPRPSFLPPSLPPSFPVSAV